MDQTTINILNQVFNIYNGSIINLEAGSIIIAKEIYYVCGIISIAVFGFNLLLRRNQDLADTHLELVKQLIYLILLYAFISNWGAILTNFNNWIQDLGNYLGNKASLASINTPVMSIEPVNVLAIGVSVAKKMLTIPFDWNIFRDAIVSFFAVVSAAAVLYCFAVIGLELMLVKIGSQIILAGGIFILGFATLPWAREYAERYIHTFFHLGIKMVFIYVLIGIGMSLSQNWVTVLSSANKDQIISTYMAVAIASYVYFKFCTKIPDQAVSWLTGRLSMGFETASDVKSAITVPTKMATAVYTKGKEIAKGVEGMAAGIQGNTRAYDAAKQSTLALFKAQGRTAGDLEIINQTLKTLGAAEKSVKQAARDKRVGDTQGGKVAQQILDDMANSERLDFSI